MIGKKYHSQLRTTTLRNDCLLGLNTPMLPDFEKYNTNDWLIPIEKKAKKVFRSLPQQTAIDVTTTILVQGYVQQAEIPWVTVFPSDSLDNICPQLLEVFKTPDGKTPAYNPDLQSAVNDLKLILYKEGALSNLFLERQAAYHLVKVAAGKTEEPFIVYQDIARKWPLYLGGWIKDLKGQFGTRKVRAAERKHNELFRLLRDNQNIIQLAKGPNQQVPVEDTSPVDLNQISKLLGTRLDVYRAAAYQIRGIPFTP